MNSIDVTWKHLRDSRLYSETDLGISGGVSSRSRVGSYKHATAEGGSTIKGIEI